MKPLTPLIIVNFKTYSEATGEKAVNLARMCEAAAKKSKDKVKVAVAVQATDIFRVSSAIDTELVSVFAQHIDSAVQGKFTGFVTAEAVKAAGAVGTLLNHAEHKVAYGELECAIARCKENRLTAVVCAKDVQEAAKVAKFNPDIVAVELPELIGTLVSVSRVNPEVVTSSITAIRKVSNVPVLCGAGVANGEDVRKALQLGTVGVILATAVVTVKNPEKALMDLISRI